MGLIEIRPEQAVAWQKWGASLMSELHEEALAAIREEGLSAEHMSIVTIDDRFFLCFFSQGAHLPPNLERSVSKEHRALLDASKIRRIEGTIIYSLRNEEARK